MKPLYQRLISEPEAGFACKSIVAANYDCPWHAHPEFELILVLQSNGYRIVGDDLAELKAGDLVLVGANLPHIWQNLPDGENAAAVHALLIQFEPGFLGPGLLDLPALAPVRDLLERAQRGLHFVGATQAAVGGLMQEMAQIEGLDRIIQFLRILGLLAESAECRPLASPGFVPVVAPHDQERMNRVFQFIHGRLDQAIRLNEAARTVNLSEGAFSRFFRTHTGKTFPAFVNEVRVGRACRLLIECDQTITEVSYECGFTNLSNFNRQFLRIKHQSPSCFRKLMQRRL